MTTDEPSPVPSGRTIRRAVVTGGAGFPGSHLCGAPPVDGVGVVGLDDLVPHCASPACRAPFLPARSEDR